MWRRRHLFVHDLLLAPEHLVRFLRNSVWHSVISDSHAVHKGRLHKSFRSAGYLPRRQLAILGFFLIQSLICSRASSLVCFVSRSSFRATNCVSRGRLHSYLSGPRTHCAISVMRATCLVRRLLRI